jgi:IS5 family transposase
MLRKKYEFDQEFSILIKLIGEMDDFILKIDKVLSDEKLFRLVESDLSKRYPNTNKTGRNSTKRRSNIGNASVEALAGLELCKNYFKC